MYHKSKESIEEESSVSRDRRGGRIILFSHVTESRRSTKMFCIFVVPPVATKTLASSDICSNNHTQNTNQDFNAQILLTHAALIMRIRFSFQVHRRRAGTSESSNFAPLDLQRYKEVQSLGVALSLFPLSTVASRSHHASYLICHHTRCTPTENPFLTEEPVPMTSWGILSRTARLAGLNITEATSFPRKVTGWLNAPHIRTSGTSWWPGRRLSTGSTTREERSTFNPSNMGRFNPTLRLSPQSERSLPSTPHDEADVKNTKARMFQETPVS
jgi:hypothetical protein